MTLVPGTRLGPYEILGPIGAGGMGEVYRARDPRLERDVAIKVLPADRMADESRRARFVREARAASALNHPNIVTVHEIGSADGLDFIVMEYVAGRTLNHLIHRQPLAVAEALRLAVPMAGALARAHAAGIVHRDLKPSNVAVSEEGVVKILDFGLAKLVGPEEPSETPGVDTQETDTAASEGTRTGLVVGTAGYMSPEQTSGGKVDARSDVFAFGAVLYEMVTGHRAFSGGSTAERLAAVLKEEPRPPTQLVASLPPTLERLIVRCLRKEPQRRPQHMADVAVELEDIRDEADRGANVQPAVGSGGSGTEAVARSRRAVPLVGAAAIAGALGVLAGQTALAPPSASSLVVRTLLPIAPAEEVNSTGFSPGFVFTPAGSRTAIHWTPEGRSLVFVGRVGDVQRLYVRPLDEDEARPLSGTEGVIAFTVSPDGLSVAFWAAREIRRIAIAGGPVSTLVEGVPASPTSLAWGEDGRLVYDLATTGTLWTAEPGRPPARLTTLLEGEVSHTLPHLLPGGRVVVFTARRSQPATRGGARVVAQVLATGERKVLVEDAADARYAAPGHLLFMWRGTLHVVRFDADGLEVRGEPTPVLDSVSQALSSGNSNDVTGAGHFDLAPNGTLAYVRAPVTPYPDRELVSIDRRGRVSPLPAPARSYDGAMRLSPSGSSIAVSILGLDGQSLWLYDLQRGTLTRFAEGTAPRWTPDGERLAFAVMRGGGTPRLNWQRADGTTPAEVLVPGEGIPSSWTPNGHHLALFRDGDVWIAPIDHPEATAPLGVGESAKWAVSPEFSPDGRWLAYASPATGRREVYVERFPGPGPRTMVSLEGGDNLAWRPDGRELFFLSLEGSMMAVEVRLDQPPVLSQPRRLFAYDEKTLPLSCIPLRCFDVAVDGQTFYGTRVRPRSPSPPVTHINLIQNWMAELTAREDLRSR